MKHLTFKTILTGVAAAMTVFSLAGGAANASGQTKIADVSQWQGTINWTKASKELKMAIIRVQHGDTGDKDFSIDKNKDINANGAYKAGVPFGQYAFAEFSSVKDAQKEARDFYARSNSHAKFYVLDNEKRVSGAKGREQTYVNAWLAQMRKLTNKKLVYYSYQNYVNVHKINASQFDGSWIAKYSNPAPNVKTDLWQYTSKGRLAGVSGNVDLSKVLNASVVNSWIGSSSSTNTTPTKKTYYKKLPAGKSLVTKKRVGEYSDKNFKHKVKVFSANKKLKFKSMGKSSHGTYRLRLLNGHYVTALTSSYK